MRYAICFTPSAGDPLTQLAASWLGRNVYSGEVLDVIGNHGLGIQELAFYTAVPRRYGFNATLKAPFRLEREMNEASLLRDLMHFSGTLARFEIPRLEIARLGSYFALVPTQPLQVLDNLAAAIVQEFDRYRAPLSEAEIERCDPDSLSAAQFVNLHRWGSPYVMDEFRFQMTLTGPVAANDLKRVDTVIRRIFEPLLADPVPVSNVALMAEEGDGGPFRVHSLHPMGKVSARRSA